MTDEIRVTVCKWADGRPLMLRWTDPVSGKRKTKTSGTRNQRKAERLAGELERELRAGGTLIPSRITWAQFREQFEDEKLAGMLESTQEAYAVALDHVDRVMGPDRLCKLTTQAMSRFVAQLRQEGMGETTIARHLRHIKAALRWAARQGYLAQAPTLEMPKVRTRMKGRPLCAEEYDRMTDAVPKVRESDPEPWRRLLEGLWLSGLRIGEAVALSWDEGPFQIDLSGRHPAFRIEGEGQKSGKTEVCPMTPDFAEFLLATSEADRTGFVFLLPGRRDGRQIDEKLAGRVVSDIGAAAHIVVDPKTGKTASAHDLRRSFGTRWSSKVMPAVLQRLMRHANVQTTMQFYVGLCADDVAAQLWAEHPPEDKTGACGNILGNIEQKRGTKQGTRETA